MKLRSLFYAFILTLVVAVFAISGIGSKPNTSLAAQNFSANLEPVAGLVQFKARSSSDWKTLEDNQLINPGDQIRTGSNGHARLTTPTGIEVAIFPTTLVQLDGLRLADNGGQIFSMLQLVGTTFTGVDVANPNDAVLVSVPTAGMIVRGTQFLTMVLPDNPNPDVSAAVIGAEDTVQVVASNNQRFDVKPQTAFYSRVKLGPNAVSTLATDVRATLFATAFSNVSGFGNNVATFKDFLKEMLQGDDNASVRTFLRNLLGLDEPDDPEDISDILDEIDALDADSLELDTTLESLVDFWINTYSPSLDTDLALETCGNGQQDDDETAENCPDDFADPALCGNNICETGAVGESLLSCPADCFVDADAALAAAQANSATINGIIIGGGPRRTPTPSGVGNTGGSTAGGGNRP
ncbi:MAG: hypothetical protein KF726_27470 [Anaerolineae bacterium]|nr:hypothetical protein [Anaerolineae bacterium]